MSWSCAFKARARMVAELGKGLLLLPLVLFSLLAFLVIPPCQQAQRVLL